MGSWRSLVARLLCKQEAAGSKTRAAQETKCTAGMKIPPSPSNYPSLPCNRVKAVFGLVGFPSSALPIFKRSGIRCTEGVLAHLSCGVAR